MYKFIITFVRRIKGNPAGLAILLVSGLSVFLAYQAEKSGHTLIAGALIGAGVSTLVSFLISVLAESSAPNVEHAFIKAAERDFQNQGYVRRNQRLEINIEEQKKGNKKPKFIRIELSSFVEPVNNGHEVEIPYFQVEPPSGLERQLEQESYVIDGAKILPNTQKSIKNRVFEKFVTTYKITDPKVLKLSDNHLWGCPVDGYEVVLNGNGSFSCTLQELAGAKELTLTPSSTEESGKSIYHVSNAAFSRQGIRWTFNRI